ncbi:MAG: response regulator [Nitrospirae bacterium]|nr:response regulator [Nitrospirota bacterium]
MKRILIVDDENLIRYSLSASLRQDDTYVKDVACGKDALDEIVHIFYNLCFLDVNLPDINGLDIMKIIKRFSPDTKIIIMTAGAVNEPAMLQSVQANADLLIPKPFDLDRIKLFVDRTLGRGMSLRRSEEQSCSGSEHEPFENWMGEDKRWFRRKAVEKGPTCSVVAAETEQGEKKLIANMLDISENGMCIRTAYRLKPGHLLKFYDNAVPRMGVVRWSKDGEAADSYRAGIQFIMPEDPSHRTLQQAQAGGVG